MCHSRKAKLRLVGCVEIYVVGRHATLAQRVSEVPHRRQHQNDLLLMMPDIGVFLHHLHHQDGVAPSIETVERSHVERKMVAEDNSKRAHGRAAPGPEPDRSGASRQRSEQDFTFSQSLAHFLRQAKGRLQTGQIFVSRSALRRVPAIGSPGHRLGAPVEEPAVGFCRELIDDSEQMAGRHGGRMDLQSSRRERSR